MKACESNEINEKQLDESVARIVCQEDRKMFTFILT